MMGVHLGNIVFLGHYCTLNAKSSLDIMDKNKQSSNAPT